MKQIYIFILFITTSCFNCWADEYKPSFMKLTEVSPNHFNVLIKTPMSKLAELETLVIGYGESLIIKDNYQTSTSKKYFIESYSIYLKEDSLSTLTINLSGFVPDNYDLLVEMKLLNGTKTVERLSSSFMSMNIQVHDSNIDVIKTYLKFGVVHILEGWDHLLFIMCLLFIAGNKSNFIKTITGFTIAHSITLSLCVLDILIIPITPIEALIALSIAFLAREIYKADKNTLTRKHPIIISSLFGLLHGLGFASALNDIGIPSEDIALALFAFNVGVEIGQIMFVISCMFLIKSLFILMKSTTINLTLASNRLLSSTSLIIGSISMYWCIERVSGF